MADIHAGLVDDCLVEKEKIGGSNYFWSFPAKADRQAQLEHQRTVQEIETLKQELEETQANLASAKRGREEDDDNDSNTDGPFDKENNNNNLEVSNSCGGGNAEDTPATSDDNNKNDELPQALPKTKRLKRSQKLARLAMVAKERAALETELKTLKENDPQALADLQHELTLVTQAANRWTDNIFNCQTYLVKKRNMNKKDVVRIIKKRVYIYIYLIVIVGIF